MNNISRKLLLSLSTALIFVLPLGASATKEEALTTQELTISADTGGKGKLSLKGKMPIKEGRTFKYKMNIAKGPFGLYYEGLGHPAAKGKGYFNGQDLSIEKGLGWIKGLCPELCVEYTKGKQSIQIGILSRYYDSAQTVGIQMKAKDIMISFDIEGILRLLVKNFTEWNHLAFFKGKDYREHQTAFQDSASGLIAFKLVWGFAGKAELTFGGSISKGDNDRVRINKNDQGFDVAQYISSVELSYKFNKPLAGFVEKITLKHTRPTGQTKKDKKLTHGVLVVVPSTSISLGLGKVHVFEQQASASLKIAYCFCDINKQYKAKVASDTNEINPYYIDINLGLSFKDAFDQKGLKIAPKLGIKFTTQSFNAHWEPGTPDAAAMDKAKKDYKHITCDFSIGFSFTKEISTEYYV